MMLSDTDCIFTMILNNNILISIIEELEIIYQDDYLVAVNKPHGLLVHRTKLSDERFLMLLDLEKVMASEQIRAISESKEN